MFNSVGFDVTIGLVFVFLLYSLLATIVQEMLATWFGMRAKMLERGIARMLNDNIDKQNARFSFRLSSVASLFGVTKPDPQTLASEFYNHPLIKYLGEDKWHSKPSYLTKQNFSAVMVDILRGINIDPATDPIEKIKANVFSEAKIKSLDGTKDITIQPETRLYLKSLLLNAGFKLDAFRTELENWFDSTMQRTTGWYKRHIQLMLFGIGLLIAHSFNLSTIEVAKTLSKDKKARENLVQMATTSIDKSKGKVDTVLYKEVKSSLGKDIRDAGTVLGQGWSEYNFRPFSGCGILNYFRLLAGFMLTAIAISLGAPFWFDMLNKLVSLRGTGDTADEKKPTAPAPAEAKK